jgi:hypothetical protein
MLNIPHIVKFNFLIQILVTLWHNHISNDDGTIVRTKIGTHITTPWASHFTSTALSFE